MRRACVLALVCAAALLAPAQAFAHAALMTAMPAANVQLRTLPGEVRLTYSEPIEPRFAIVSVENSRGTAETSGAPSRAPGDPRTLVVPLKHLKPGWYLVFWRVIAQDGHPVRGAYTFALGPNPGPAPQFSMPSLSESAATPALVVLRWIVLLSMMIAVGLLAFRALVARPLATRLPATRMRRSTIALGAALAVALVATPVYVLVATAHFALRAWTNVSALLPLIRISSFGRSFLDLELLLALFAVCCACVVATERPSLRRRTVAEVFALTGAAVTGSALLVVPGLAGHPAQTSPRGIAMPADWLHLMTGSIWIGGLAGLLILWSSSERTNRIAVLGVVVPRFSRIAFASVMLLIASGAVASALHLPTLASLWQTSYGRALLLKIGLLLLAMLLAAGNLARTKPRLEAAAAHADEKLGVPAALLLRRLTRGEVALVSGAILGVAILTSLTPPSKALASLAGVAARVGPGAVQQTVRHGSYRIALRVTPNKAARPNDFELKLTQNGQSVRGAQVNVQCVMLDMDTQTFGYVLPETAPGTYAASKPALAMVGHWGLHFSITPPHGQAFNVTVVDTAGG